MLGRKIKGVVDLNSLLCVMLGENFYLSMPPSNEVGFFNYFSSFAAVSVDLLYVRERVSNLNFVFINYN